MVETVTVERAVEGYVVVVVVVETVLVVVVVWCLSVQCVGGKYN